MSVAQHIIFMFVQVFFFALSSQSARTVGTISQHKNGYVIPKHHMFPSEKYMKRFQNDETLVAEHLAKRIMHGTSLSNFPLLGKCFLVSRLDWKESSVNIS